MSFFMKTQKTERRRKTFFFEKIKNMIHLRDINGALVWAQLNKFVSLLFYFLLFFFLLYAINYFILFNTRHCHFCSLNRILIYIADLMYVLGFLCYTFNNAVKLAVRVGSFLEEMGGMKLCLMKFQVWWKNLIIK